MVQRKVINNKLGIQASILKTDKKQAIINPSIQNHDGKTKGADLKAVKMKKSRSVKRSNVDISHHTTPEIHEVARQLGKPPQFVTPVKTPSPKKTLPCKYPYMSPNYMKSTSSSEARKERKTAKESSNASISKLHKVAKTLNKLSSLKKMRALTKSPSFKHTRSGSCKKVVLCQNDDLDVQRATCSSTLKDSKFPHYLKLKPGATEAEGNSVFKVCPYTYCSLNGHEHVSAPPLKRFLASRRRLLKTLKVKPEVLSPRIAKATENNKAIEERDRKEDFFVEVYVPDKEVSESMSDGPCSEIDLQDDLDQTEDTNLSGINFSLEDVDFPPTPLQTQTSFESQSSPSEFFGENSDMEWEEGQSPATHDKYEDYVQTEYSKVQDEPEFELNNGASEYLEFLADAYTPCFHDEIVECLSFSDTDSLPDNESTQTDDKYVKELNMVIDDMNFEPKNEITEESHLSDEATVHAVKLEDESMNEQGTSLFDLIEEFTEAQNEELESYEFEVETDADESNEGNYTVGDIREEDVADFVLEDSSRTKEDSETDQSDSGNEADASHSITNNGNVFPDKDFTEWERTKADNCTSKRAANSEEEEKYSNNVELRSDENTDVEVKESETQDHKTEAADASLNIRNNIQEARKRISNKRESDCNLELLDSCSKLKRFLRCRKADEDIEEEKEFNPRGPNFLTIEPEPESEKVDLRHQEMDERRNADEWMLDYALQKTVNQLAPARKRKVALLVEAFESVLPIPKFESHMRKNTSGFPNARPIQACR
ncbi:uncharacterized protein LOC110715029 [Chenopodium quinoa]|uniref:uncharacterized protein LOC110715029 n=1 Tax=Chenopodium quinoa TaxID=63459 RepID=UPI000B786007|nr:uncharacterized protein LOC110715029 [Chenopodium quinoa]XP_021749292.1 uncharacterized protein LOC110715029 [Chenopodium quinoa]XP_021749293.1 uncharacterized protein LOC110715029 [Chenopodium quinoa]